MKVDKAKLFRYVLLVISISFYMLWFWVDGIRIESDTNGYVNFAMSREPLYPTFLALFRFLFGEVYFEWVGVFQSLFWGYAVWHLCDVLYRRMELDKLSFGVMVGLCFATSLITRFLANRRALYSLDIASEGLAIPLFMWFATELFQYAMEQKKRHLTGIIILGILLISVRKQMYIVVPVMGAVFCLMWLLRQIKFRKLLLLCGLAIATFAGSVIFDMGYNYVIRGEAVRHSTDSSALLINAVFAATESDAQNIEDADVRQLFLDIIKQKTDNGYGYESSPKGLRALSAHYSDNFDNIAFGIVNPSFYAFLSEKGVEGTVATELAFGELNDYMFASVVGPNIPKMFNVFIANTVSGACNTVAKDSDILIPAVILLYAVFVGGIIYLGINKKLIPEVWFALITAVCVGVNLVVVSALIFSQSRYMIYNMPLFYCSLFGMFRKVLMMITERKREKNG